MDRVSTNLPNDSMQFYLRERQEMMLRTQNQIASQSRIEELRDDPIAAAHATRYRSYQVRLERFSDNTQTIKHRNQLTEGYLQQAVDMLQRARELAVQGANGSYAPEDLAYMGGEVDQLLAEMIEVANARSADGTTMFAGDRSLQLPFRPLRGISAGGARELITEVQYTGTINQQFGEISERNYVQTNFPGNQVFWAEQQRILSRTGAEGFQVDQDATILVDGREIQLRAGDTAFSVVEKINASGALVRATIDPVFGSVVLTSTSPHQIWLQDGPDSTVLQELGLINGDRPPQNLAVSANRSGGSAFDALIKLRDQLFDADQEAVGSRGILGLDLALDNMLTNLGRLGAINARLDTVYQRTEHEVIEVAAQDSRLTDVDMAQAITDLSRLEATHRAALGVSARVIQPTLLDFLR